MKHIASKVELILYSLLILFLPTQLGKHFIIPDSVVAGIRIDYLFPVIYTTDVLIGMLFVIRCAAFFSKKLTRHRATSWQTPLRGFLLAWFLSLIITSMFAARGVESWYGVSKWLEYAFFAWYTSWILAKKKIHLWVLLGLSVVFESVLAVLQLFHQGALGSILYFLGERAIYPFTIGAANVSMHGQLFLRPYATFSHPNQLAGYLVIIFILFLFNFQISGAGLKKHAFFVLGTSLVAVFATLSRSGISVLLLSLVTYCVFFLRSKLVRIGIITGVVLVFLLSSALAIRFFTTSLSEQAVQERITLSRVAFSITMHRPFFGVGLNNFIPSIPSFYHGTLSHAQLQPVHNIFLLVAAETGGIGVVFFTGFLYLTYRKLLIRPATPTFVFSKESLVAALSAMLILGQLDHYFLTLQQTQLLFAFVLGCCFVKKAVKVKKI